MAEIGPNVSHSEARRRLFGTLLCDRHAQCRRAAQLAPSLGAGEAALEDVAELGGHLGEAGGEDARAS